jgi:HSP20 family protein
MTETLVQHNGSQDVAQPRSGLAFTPRFDIWEKDDGYVLVGDLPGVEPQDLDVRYEKQELTIHGKVGPRNYKGNHFAEEYGVGDFRRSFSLGELIDGTNIYAELKDGVLTVYLPKRVEARPRKIAIKAN